MTHTSIKPQRHVVKVSRTQVKAAQLRVDLDKRLGEDTPAIINPSFDRPRVGSASGPAACAAC